MTIIEQTAKSNGRGGKVKKNEGGLVDTPDKPATNTPVKVQSLKVARVVITVRGTSPLIVHAWSEKAKKMMRDKQQLGASTRKKDLKDPEADFNGARYFNEEGIDCVPACGFANAFVKSARWSDLKMSELRGVFYVLGERLPILHADGTPYKGKLGSKDAPTMREDMVRVFGGTADLRYRPEYAKGWVVDLPIEYNASSITPTQLCELINLAGFSVGVFEWRPERNGQYGRFEADLSMTNKIIDAVTNRVIEE